MEIVNKFFTLDSYAHRIHHFQQRLCAACERNDEKAAYEALHFIEQTLVSASKLKLSPAPDATPVKGDRWQKSHKYCACCGAWRGAAPLNDSTGIHEVVSICKYKVTQRGDGRMYETYPGLLAGIGVYRNGGTSDDQYVCADCLTIGLRYARDRINDILGESDCVPNKLTPISGIQQPCVACAALLPAEKTGLCEQCQSASNAYHTAQLKSVIDS